MKTELTLSQLAAIGAGASQFVEGKALIGNLTVHPTRSGYTGDQPFREAFARAVRDAVLSHIVDPDKMKTPEICLRPDCGVGITHYEGSHPAVGDVVQLKSGGPKMTIAALSEQTSLVPCQWFGEKNLRSHAFPQACLTLVTE